jgi:hypothetical protein
VKIRNPKASGPPLPRPPSRHSATLLSKLLDHTAPDAEREVFRSHCLLEKLLKRSQAPHSDHCLAVSPRALNIPSESNDVFDQEPINEVSRTNCFADPDKRLLVALGVFPFDEPCCPQQLRGGKDGDERVAGNGDLGASAASESSVDPDEVSGQAPATAMVQRRTNGNLRQKVKQG